MALIPPAILKRLYVVGSLANVANGCKFSVKNTLARGTIAQVHAVRIDGRELPLTDVTLRFPDRALPATAISPAAPCIFPINQAVDVVMANLMLNPGPHQIGLSLKIKEFGDASVEFTDTVV
jgi:hypothetical protein